MGWEAQCGADLRHLLHTLQHLPLDPQQAPTNVGPLVTLCTTRFAALPTQPTPPSHPGSPSNSPQRSRQLHRSLTESDAQTQQRQSRIQTPTPSVKETSNRGTSAEDHADAQEQRPGSNHAELSNGLQLGQQAETQQDGLQQTMAAESKSGLNHRQLATPTPTKQSLAADGESDAHEHADAYPGSHQSSDDATTAALDQHPEAESVQRAAEVLDQGADQDISTDNNGEVDMVATSNDMLAVPSPDILALQTLPHDMDAGKSTDVADSSSDKPL